jgi:acylphosphatase
MNVRLRVSGRVQGVGYRDWAARHAASLGLAGWVRNRRDGTVEAVFCGAEEAVRAMIDRCRRGPLLAQVASISEAVETVAPEPGFHQLPTA